MSVSVLSVLADVKGAVNSQNVCSVTFQAYSSPLKSATGSSSSLISSNLTR